VSDLSAGYVVTVMNRVETLKLIAARVFAKSLAPEIGLASPLFCTPRARASWIHLVVLETNLAQICE
jgi:hypothetical protein